jgi:hypothetical protein
MSCAFARLTVWTLRRWFASDRSLRARAPLELFWIEQDLAPAALVRTSPVLLG